MTLEESLQQSKRGLLWVVIQRLDAMQFMLDQFRTEVRTKMATFSETLAGLKEDMAVLQTQVAETADAETSAAQAFHALADQLSEILNSGTDLAGMRTSVQGFVSQLHDSADSLAAAVVTTPAGGGTTGGAAGSGGTTADPVTGV